MERRLDDVVKSNLSLQNMLQSVLTNLTSKNHAEVNDLTRKANPTLGFTSADKSKVEQNTEGRRGGSTSSEKRWDLLCKSSDDEAHADVTGSGESDIKQKIVQKVIYIHLRETFIIWANYSAMNCMCWQMQVPINYDASLSRYCFTCFINIVYIIKLVRNIFTLTSLEHVHIHLFC